MKQSINIIVCLILIFTSCKPDPIEVPVHDTTPYELDFENLPAPTLPDDNILTVEKVKLGRMLFYEEKLSRTESQSCATCHNQADAFTDTLQFSIGVQELPGKRQAMTIFNMAWHDNQFFWDGRANLLRDQALLPIQDELEMDETLENVENKLNQESVYRDQFIRAFGDDNITSEKISLALEQFMLSIVSDQSKFDKAEKGEVAYTASEMRGKTLFYGEYNKFFPEISGADCAHCHSGNNFENNLYMNNGLDSENEITDNGRMEVTMLEEDKGKFKVTSLRNIAVTAPYMHDGRFKTLEEVIDHYNEGIKISQSLDLALLATKETGLMLDEQEKKDLINFLKTLTDETFLNNPAYANPF